ncbi:sporulation protein YjcZ [Neobacillus sp. NRS-1170]|uniref:sporulation protein YjcZ n=1 Tax=Neobacillus sp. NRS-1170 TaxID=3233898 RepID=UPI003D2DC293
MFGYGYGGYGHGGCGFGYGGYGYGGCGFGGGFALIVVLFILLIIVGAACFRW